MKVALQPGQVGMANRSKTMKSSQSFGCIAGLRRLECSSESERARARKPRTRAPTLAHGHVLKPSLRVTA